MTTPNHTGLRGTGQTRRPGLAKLNARHLSPRVLVLAASIAWRHLTADRVRAVVLAWRALPGPLRGWLRFAGPYGRAATLWGAGERSAALASLDSSSRRLAAFSLAVDQPGAAAAALAKLPAKDKAWPQLTARLAWREGRIADAIEALGVARGRKARRLRRILTAEQAVLTAEQAVLTAAPARSDPAAGARQGPQAARGAGAGRGGRVAGRVLHMVTDALPPTSAGYTIRTHEIAIAQRSAGLDPHVVTGPGYPVTKGNLDGRGVVVLDDVPYHRLLPWTLPRLADAAMDQAVALAARLVERLRPAVLHPASNYLNARTALALRDRYGTPVIYEVRGFWEDTWLSRHPDTGQRAASDQYRWTRDAETACMRAADLVITLGVAMRDEIVARGVDADKVLIVPNAVSEEFLLPLPEAGALRAELGIEPGEFVAGVVSSLTRYEGIGTLLEATALLRERGIPARALIVGDGTEGAALARQAAGLDLIRPRSSPAAFRRRGYVSSTRSSMCLSCRVPRTGCASLSRR